MKQLTDIVNDIEREMVTLWSTGEVTHIMKRDSEFITMIMTAIMFDKEHFRAMGLEIGESQYLDIMTYYEVPPTIKSLIAKTYVKMTEAIPIHKYWQVFNRKEIDTFMVS